MATFIRKVIAGPRAWHDDSNLDLCYVTDNIIATSGPSDTYPQTLYRTPIENLVKFLDSKHKDKWAIWEFRAEGTGYPDSEVYGRIRHYPFPDHHPPPFALIPHIMASMRDWLKGDEDRVVVVHCKAGKGRSGTASCSYLISEEGWTVQDALNRFTERRMRPGFGYAGVSIPSQLRWVGYVDRWKTGGKLYVESAVEVTELHIWGLRDGVSVAVRGFINEGKKIKVHHSFTSAERTMVKGEVKSLGFADAVRELMNSSPSKLPESGSNTPRTGASTPISTSDAMFRPSEPILIDTNDINIDCERRTHGATITVAHVWFNTFFEGNGPEQGGKSDNSGVFEIEFDAMDGIKGSSRKGTKCFDRLSVVWKVRETKAVIPEPKEGEEVKQAQPANWQGADPEDVAS
jgi:protein-tyrosine phosphatase